MKKVFLISIISLLLIIGILTKPNKTKEPQTIEPYKTLAIYIENDNGEYEVYNSNEWPTEGYTLDKAQSKCENGGNLSWDNTNKKVLLSSKETDKCYVYLKKEDIKYWIDDAVDIYLYPNTPSTTYSIPDDIPGIATYFVYIRTDGTSHAACLRYNNKDFCLRPNYWDTDGATTKAKLQADMEAAFETPVTNCYSDSSDASCYVDGFRCSANSDNLVYCMNDSSFRCAVFQSGVATCI